MVQFLKLNGHWVNPEHIVSVDEDELGLRVNLDSFSVLSDGGLEPDGIDIDVPSADADALRAWLDAHTDAGAGDIDDLHVKAIEAQLALQDDTQDNERHYRNALAIAKATLKQYAEKEVGNITPLATTALEAIESELGAWTKS